MNVELSMRSGPVGRIGPDPAPPGRVRQVYTITFLVSGTREGGRRGVVGPEVR